MVYVVINWWPDFVKKFLTYIFPLAGLFIAFLGYETYNVWHQQIAMYGKSGGKYMKEFNLNYDSFKDHAYVAIGMAGVSCIMSFLTVMYKNPTTSLAYIVGTFGMSFYVYLVSRDCYKYESQMFEIKH